MDTLNENWVEQVRKNLDSRNNVIRQLFNDPKIQNSIYAFILKNGGTREDAHDMLTHAIISFVKQCYSPVFELKYSINTYLYSIARYAWINKNKKTSLEEYTDIEYEYIDYEESIEEKIIGEDRMMMLRKALTHLDEKCREVLMMWANKIKMREIAIKMNYASEGMARKKKHQCLQKLKSLIGDI